MGPLPGRIERLYYNALLMRSSFLYLLFYKPFGVLSHFTDTEGRLTLKSFIPVKGVYSAGRLDYDSEGLLLLTNHGALIQRLTDPDFHLPKTYWVQVEGQITEAALQSLRQGIVIQGEQTRRCQARLIPEPDLLPRSKPITPHQPPSWIELILQEGRKRQIRHMTAAVGFPTLRLIRSAIGPLGIEGLQPGVWRYLTVDELNWINHFA